MPHLAIIRNEVMVMKQNHVIIECKKCKYYELNAMLDDAIEKVEKDNLRADGTADILSVAFFICVFILICVALYGHRLEQSIVDRCSESVLAYNVNTWHEVQQYTDNQGYVRETNVYSTIYEFELDGNTYAIGFQSWQPIEYTGLVDVYYNPDDHSEWYADGSVFDCFMHNVNGNWINNKIGIHITDEPDIPAINYQ